MSVYVKPTVVYRMGLARIEKAVSRNRYSGRTTFSIFEENADGTPRSAYSDGTPRDSLRVEVYHPQVPRDLLRGDATVAEGDEVTVSGRLRGAEVSWPSTSDKRVTLARLLATALRLAAAEADRLNLAAAEAAADGFFQDRAPGDVPEGEYRWKVGEFLRELGG